MGGDTAALRKLPQLVLLSALLLSTSMWLYVPRILVPFQMADAAAHESPRGNLSDLYPRWLGTRELLLHHRDPYSADVTREVQAGYYGRPLEAERSGDPKDQQGFAYPVYVVFLLAPTVQLPFPAVQAAFRWLLLLLSAASVLFWLRGLRWRPPLLYAATMVVMTLGSFAVVQGVKLQQLSLLVSGLIALSVALLASEQLVASGALLALAMIKPQLAVPLAGWLLIWAFSRWRERCRFALGFGLTMAALLVGGEFVLPGWMGQFLEAVSAYRRYTSGAGSLLDVLITPSWGRVLAAAVVLGVIAFCWKVRRADTEQQEFLVATSLVLAATVVIVPMVAPYNQLLLLPGIFLAVRYAGVLWKRDFLTRAMYVISAGMIFWPWLTAFGLVLASYWWPVQKAWAVPLYTSMGIPLGVLALVVAAARPFTADVPEE